MISINRMGREPFTRAMALSLVAVLGCNELQDGPALRADISTPAIVDKREVLDVTAAAAPATPVDVASSQAAIGDEPPKAGEPDRSEEAKPMVADYQAPFPDRVDLFVPPKRLGRARVEGETGDAVDLLGFVRLERQQAVLSINGQITQIAEGASQDGVEVISIQPPNVVLQRGRQRWQDSLEN
jgi:hypothetical protein